MSADRKVFRLCVIVLEAASWPDSVLISEWFFQERDNENKRKLAGDRDHTPATVTIVYTHSTAGALPTWSMQAVNRACRRRNPHGERRDNLSDKHV